MAPGRARRKWHDNICEDDQSYLPSPPIVSDATYACPTCNLYRNAYDCDDIYVYSHIRSQHLH
eukprot:3357675-Pyramimonas_sp.AAC.1